MSTDKYKLDAKSKQMRDELDAVDGLMADVACVDNDQGAHYRYKYKVKLTEIDIKRGFVVINLDPFRIAQIYKISCFALQTILKKCLCTGKRGHKDANQDLDDIINAARRKKEMLMEDKANE